MSPLNITQPLGIWSTRWLLFQVMSNIPKMGQLPTPGWSSLITAVPYMVNDDIRWLMIDGLIIVFPSSSIINPMAVLKLTNLWGWKQGVTSGLIIRMFCRMICKPTTNRESSSSSAGNGPSNGQFHNGSWQWINGSIGFDLFQWSLGCIMMYLIPWFSYVICVASLGRALLFHASSAWTSGDTVLDKDDTGLQHLQEDIYIYI